MITCTLKHNTEQDLILQISSASSRMKATPDTSSISVVVPNGIYLASEVALRLAGWLELSFDGVDYAFSDTITSAPVYEGASSTSIQINATGLFPTMTPPEVDLEGVSYMTVNVNGDIRIRAEFDPNIIPGSTVNYDGESYTVDTITFTQTESNSTMELGINA